MISVSEHDDTFAGPGTAFRFRVDLNESGEVIGSLETFLHDRGPTTVTFTDRPPFEPVMEAWLKMMALAQQYCVGLIEVADPENLFPPDRRPGPTGTNQIEVRG
jgi:hypothetical protein